MDQVKDAQTTQPLPNPAAEQLKLENQFKNGANWFYWIAGLSVINSMILIFGGEISFIVGLGITQLVDAIAWEFRNSGGLNLDFIFFTASLLISGIFVLFGYLSRKKIMGIYIAGMILYVLDGLIFFLVSDWLSMGFHLFVLFSLFGGLKALRIIREQGKAATLLTKPIG